MAGGGISIINGGRHNIKDAEAGWRSIKETKGSDVSNSLNNKSNALATAANATATTVVAVAVAAADKSTTAAKQATSQPLLDNKTAVWLYSHQGRTNKKDRNELCGGSREMALLLQTSKVGRIILAWGGRSQDIFLILGEDRGFKSPREEPT